MVDRLVNSEVNKNRIGNVENCFGISGTPLTMPGRVLVGEGVLIKNCRKKQKKRQFFLFNDVLVYGNIVVKNKKYTQQRIIPLEEVKLEDIKDDEVMHNGWLIKTPTKSFAVYAATPTEKTEWMQHIQRCVDDLIKRTGKQPTGEHAAVWVPDGEATKCMHCNKSEFGLLNRRHHCRSCGAVICGGCSKHKFLIPTQSSKPVRVCDTCYGNLSKGRTGINSEVVNESQTENASNAEETEAVKIDLNESESDFRERNVDAEYKNALTSESSDSEDESKDSGLEAIEAERFINEKPTFYNTEFNNEEVSETNETKKSEPEKEKEEKEVK